MSIKLSPEDIKKVVLEARRREMVDRSIEDSLISDPLNPYVSPEENAFEREKGHEDLVNQDIMDDLDLEVEEKSPLEMYPEGVAKKLSSSQLTEMIKGMLVKEASYDDWSMEDEPSDIRSGHEGALEEHLSETEQHVTAVRLSLDRLHKEVLRMEDKGGEQRTVEAFGKAVELEKLIHGLVRYFLGE